MRLPTARDIEIASRLGRRAPHSPTNRTASTMDSPTSMTFPKPDRSNYKLNLVKTAWKPQVDIGWNEGILRDGRPYRVECWAQEQVTALTFFFSAQGLERYTNEQFADFLESEKLLTYRADESRSAAARKCKDGSGNKLWSVNVVVGDDEDTFVDVTVQILPYS